MKLLINFIIFLLGFLTYVVIVIYKNYPQNITRSTPRAYSSSRDIYSKRFQSIDSARLYFSDQTIKEQLVFSFFDGHREGGVTKTLKVFLLTFNAISYYFLTFVGFVKSADFISILTTSGITAFGNFTPQSAIELQYYEEFLKMMKLQKISDRMAIRAKTTKNNLLKKMDGIDGDITLPVHYRLGYVQVSEFERGLCDNPLQYHLLITYENGFIIVEEDKNIDYTTVNKSFGVEEIIRSLLRETFANRTKFVGDAMNKSVETSWRNDIALESCVARKSFKSKLQVQVPENDTQYIIIARKKFCKAKHVLESDPQYLNVKDMNYLQPCKEIEPKQNTMLLIAAIHLVSLLSLSLPAGFYIGQDVHVPYIQYANCPRCGELLIWMIPQFN